MKKKHLLALVALLVVAALFATLYFKFRPQGTADSKSIVVEVIHGDGSSKDFPLTTAHEFLGPALVESGVVEDNQGEYGLYILTADGETAKESQQEWWCITRASESLTTGADDTPLADGEHYELTLTVGYDS